MGIGTSSRGCKKSVSLIARVLYTLTIKRKLMPAKFFMHLPVKMFHQCFSVRDDDRRVAFIIVIITCYHGHSGHHHNCLHLISAAPLTPQPWKYVDQKPESWSWFSFSPASRFCLLTPSVITFYQVSNIKLFEKKFLLPLASKQIKVIHIETASSHDCCNLNN